MKTIAKALVIMCLSAPAALAGNTCTFTTLCTDTQPCTATEFSLIFRAGTGGPNDIELDVGDEIVGVAVGGNAQVAHIAGLSQTGFHVLTLASGTGAARYTRHVDDGPLAMTWHGTCEIGP